MQAAAARLLGGVAQARLCIKRASPWRVLEAPARVQTELHNLGYLELHDGEVADAKASFHEAFAMARQSRDDLTLRYSILDGAIVAPNGCRLDDATNLPGTAQGHFDAVGAVLHPDLHVEMERAVAATG